MKKYKIKAVITDVWLLEVEANNDAEALLLVNLDQADGQCIETLDKKIIEIEEVLES